MNDALIKRIEDRTAVVGIVGMGYVGLPLALAFTSKGFRVLGFDIDPGKVKDLNAGRSYISHIPEDVVGAMKDRFEATDDFARAGEADALLLCVPTPLTRQREPDTTYIERTMASLAPSIRKDQLVVLESTTYPGTTREKVAAVVEGLGLEVGRDVFVAYSPEREDPGNADFSTSRIPKVVGADDEASRESAVALYGAVMREVVQVSSTATAEAVKLTENIFRGVNIALVNELKVIYDRMGIDVWEVIDAAKTKPFGYMPFYPGPGLGGHCIPIDPFYLTWKAREYDISTRFIELAGEINTAMPNYVLGKLQNALNERGQSLKGARVLILGLAYKRNVGDMRESPSLRLFDLLRDRGAHVDYHDPFIPVIPSSREYSHLEGIASKALDEDMIAGCDAVLIATDHGGIDYAMVARCARLVVDTRNACPKGEGVVKA
ncbi:MAG: nucleotide sugar dehydrogenase [Deltaproteobacteria bacterium]|nr:nucleotide sugar dehydrogenase [Deltaproteobacteria bacterium]